MNGSAETVTALRSAFDALIAITTPDRAVPALQRALRDLLEEPAPARSSGTTPRPSKRSRARWVGDIAAWRPVRDKVLARLTEHNMTRRQLCDVVGIAYPTLRCSLLPRGRAPGKANLERLRNWADQQEPAIGNQAEDDLPPSDETRTGNGQAAPLIALPRRLTRDQRARLAGYAELDGLALRKSTGVAGDQIEQAIAGAALGGEVYGRLLNFLEQPEP